MNLAERIPVDCKLKSLAKELDAINYKLENMNWYVSMALKNLNKRKVSIIKRFNKQVEYYNQMSTLELLQNIEKLKNSIVNCDRPISFMRAFFIGHQKNKIAELEQLLKLKKLDFKLEQI